MRGRFSFEICNSGVNDTGIKSGVIYVYTRLAEYSCFATEFYFIQMTDITEAVKTPNIIFVQ